MRRPTVTSCQLLATALAPLLAACGGGGGKDTGGTSDAAVGAIDSSAMSLPDSGTPDAPGPDSAGPTDAGGSLPDSSGAYDGPVTNAACPKLPAAGQWQNISPPGSNYTTTYTGINAVAVRPDNPAVIYAGADSNGIFKSTDCGATWALVNTGANAAAISSGRPWSLAIDQVTPDVMYTAEGYGASGLWKSTNAGVDWQQVLTADITSAFYSGGQITSISIDPTDHTHLVVESHGNCASGGFCAAESSDSGATWTLVDLSSVGMWQEGSAIAIVNRKNWMMCAVFGGLFRTGDEGASWQSIDAGGALPVCNNYEPILWQAANGAYYLPAIAYAGPGLLQSQPNDTTSWSIVPNSPQASLLIPTDDNLFLARADESAPAGYWTASQSDPTTWQSIPGPPSGDPTVSGNIGGGAEDVAYDGTHHAIYVATNSTGLWQSVIE